MSSVLLQEYDELRSHYGNASSKVMSHTARARNYLNSRKYSSAIDEILSAQMEIDDFADNVELMRYQRGDNNSMRNTKVIVKGLAKHVTRVEALVVQQMTGRIA